MNSYARYVSQVQFASGATNDAAHFYLAAHHGHGADEVRVWLDLRHDTVPPALQRTRDGWQLRIERPPVQRLEYLFVLRLAGHESMIVDPENPLRAHTAFGDHSVLEFPGYRRPRWLDGPVDVGERTSFAIRASGLLRPLAVTIRSPVGFDGHEPLPLLLVHDGPEFDERAAISRFSSAMIAAGRLPAHRLALLAPGDRNRWYAALPAYADALREVVLPAIGRRVAIAGRPALSGASLGALAGLHAALQDPEMISGLFLQSGSFFDRDIDAHESSFGGFASVTDFVESISANAAPPLDVGMTCGLAEENLANNRRTAALLAERGHRVELSEVPDAHTYTGWRDALDPHLVDLLRRAWSIP